MFRHVVMFTFAEGTTDAQIDAVLQGLAGLPVAIPEIRKYSYGRDAGLAAGNFSLAVVAEFANEADYLVYRDHPAHQEFIATLVRPIVGTGPRPSSPQPTDRSRPPGCPTAHATAARSASAWVGSSSE